MVAQSLASLPLLVTPSGNASPTVALAAIVSWGDSEQLHRPPALQVSRDFDEGGGGNGLRVNSSPEAEMLSPSTNFLHNYSKNFPFTTNDNLKHILVVLGLFLMSSPRNT